MDLESHSRTDARLRTLSQLFVAGKGFFVIAESFERKKEKKITLSVASLMFTMWELAPE